MIHCKTNTHTSHNGDTCTRMENWKRVSGIMCDRRISLRVNGKVYKTVIRPAMMYSADMWAVKKAQEKKLDVAEMRMLRWMSGVTKLDRIRNERIRGTTKVGEISEKVQESRLKWYGHVLRREDQYVGKRVMAMLYVRKLVSLCAYSCVSGSDILRVMYNLSLNLMDFRMPIVIQVHLLFVFFKSQQVVKCL